MRCTGAFPFFLYESIMDQLLEQHGIKPTPNRVMIAKALHDSGRPLSMTELETLLETIDKSNISRTLSLFRENHLVHALEDTGEGIRYELCHSHSNHSDDDLHVHFYCTSCHKTFCLEDTPIPKVPVPEGFKEESANYIIKGLCPKCNKS